MSRYRTLPQAETRIQRALAALRLTPVDPAVTPSRSIKHRARYYMGPMKTLQGGTVWVKAGLQSDPHLRRALREEIRIQRLFAEYERHSHPRFDSPSYVAHHDDRRGFLWLVRRYWDGMFAGDMTDWFGFSPAFFRIVRPKTMAAIVADIGQMTKFIGGHTKLETHDAGWYLMDLHYYRREFIRPMVRHWPAPSWNSTRVEAIPEFFLRHHDFIRRHATTFTHGDMYPTNIMIRGVVRRPVVLFDWELSHLNLPTFDAVMVYLHAWRKPGWQAEFKKSFLRQLGDRPKHRLAWNIVQVSLATRLAGFCFIRLHELQPDRYPRLPRSQRATLERLYRHYLQKITDGLEGDVS